MVEWQWNLHRFSDQAFLGRFENAKERRLAPAFNAAGAGSFSVTLDDELGALIDNLSTYIVVKRNNATVWEGKVWDTQEDAAANRMQVNCMGWFEEPNHRYTDTELLFTNFSCGRIAWSLLAHAESVDGSMGFVVGTAQDAGFTIPRLTIPKDQNIAQEISKLTEVENGIDFYFDYASRMFQFTGHNGVDRPNVHFGFRRGPNNLQNVTRARQGSRICNKMKVINGRTNSYVYEDDPTSIAARGTYREIMTLNGLKNDPEGSEEVAMRAFGAAEVTLRKDPLSVYDLTVMPPGIPVMVPMPYDDFNLGDTARLSVDRGRFSVSNQVVRIYGFDLSIDDNNNERLNSVQLSPS